MIENTEENSIPLPTDLQQQSTINEPVVQDGNPLAQYFRHAKLQIELPTGGNFWPEGSIDLVEGKFLDVGKVSSGLKEKESSEGTTYLEMTKILKPLILSESGRRVKVKPITIVSVTYQNIQKSPTYSSGFAMRFPRITNYRPDRNIHDIADLKDIKKEAGHSFLGD